MHMLRRLLACSNRSDGSGASGLPPFTWISPAARTAKDIFQVETASGFSPVAAAPDFEELELRQVDSTGEQIYTFTSPGGTASDKLREVLRSPNGTCFALAVRDVVGQGAYGTVVLGEIPGHPDLSAMGSIAVKKIAVSSRRALQIATREFEVAEAVCQKIPGAAVRVLGMLVQAGIKDLTESKDTPVPVNVYIVMEAAGPTMSQWTKNLESDSVDRASRIARYMLGPAQAVVALNGIGVHCDIKPDNILGRSLLPECGMLADFGSVLCDGERAQEATGTTGYRAPEVINCETVTSASDVYSMGVVILTALGLNGIKNRTDYWISTNLEPFLHRVRTFRASNPTIWPPYLMTGEEKLDLLIAGVDQAVAPYLKLFFDSLNGQNADGVAAKLKQTFGISVDAKDLDYDASVSAWKIKLRWLFGEVREVRLDAWLKDELGGDVFSISDPTRSFQSPPPFLIKSGTEFDRSRAKAALDLYFAVRFPGWMANTWDGASGSLQKALETFIDSEISGQTWRGNEQVLEWRKSAIDRLGKLFGTPEMSSADQALLDLALQMIAPSPEKRPSASEVVARLETLGGRARWMPAASAASSRGRPAQASALFGTVN